MKKLLASLLLFASSAFGQTALTTTNVPSDITGVKNFAQSKLCVKGATSGSVCFTTSAIAGSGTLNIGTGGTLGTAAFTAASAYEVPLSFSTGLTRSTNTITVNASQNIATLSNLTSNGFVKTTGGTGALSVDTSTYEVPLTFSTGLTRTTNTVTVNTSQNIATLSNLTSNGLVKTTGGTGALSIDTTAYTTNPMTTGGDVIYGGASGVPTRLANGSSPQVLTSSGGTSAPTWAAISGTQVATATGGEDSITANATGTQASCTQLSSSVYNHRVTTSGAGHSVCLPAATVGQRHYVRNDGANYLMLFGQSTETINGVASATGIALQNGTGALFASETAGKWTSTFLNLYPGDQGSNTVGTPGNILAASLTSNASVTAAGASRINFTNRGTIIAPVASSGAIGIGPSSVSVGGDALLRTEIPKSVTGIANATGTATFTVTIPNGAHSGMLKTTLNCSLGAGGAIGANEATGTVSYDVAIARTSGVNAVVTFSTAYGSAMANVAGASTITVTAAASAISGAVGATNTFTVDVTVSRGTGSSTNHTCFAYGRLLNANASGITIS